MQAVGALKLVALVMLSAQMAYCVQDPNIAKMNNLTAISILLDHLPESAREWWPVYKKAFDMGHLPENKYHLSRALRVTQQLARDVEQRNSLVEYGFVQSIIPLLSRSMLSKEDIRNVLLSLVLLAQHTKDEFPSADKAKVAKLQGVLEANNEVTPVRSLLHDTSLIEPFHHMMEILAQIPATQEMTK
ncbi:hypothetical protein GUITHDRAFT_103670 [Guillardia theta CCMP2712]|uniref:Uncharacterized protein n=1 Tax=Guillardia theta (strain CCMP2712) TaxID=905079 RepID=L1JPC2_GUITC|nr:hypothetical protein GUITHDRAFT_103670 [Guillardia theta CCMP2712]EKX50436.1 hypothetical protein GUITHDRAFT_103670 [Guillardia theta CCMP2712]|eukprot:XP_005837416.1 hypothetical protein GUITHDRAFT_103670 [Guillardia theta CCMP2712]